MVTTRRPPAAAKPPRFFRLILFLFAGFACAIVLAFSTVNIVSSRESLLENERESLSRLAETVAAQTAGLFGNLEFFLDATNRWLASHPDIDPRFDPDFVAFVDSYRAANKGIIDLRLVSGKGELFYIPSKDAKPLADVRDRGYFTSQQDPATRGFHIAEPVKSRVTGLWGIPVSYPLAAGNAGMAVAFAVIELPDLDALYELIRPKPNGTILLFRKDGLLLARTPFDEALIGTRMDDEREWETLFATGGEGTKVASKRGLDGSNRIAAYKTLADSELLIAVTADIADILAPWRRRLPLDIGIAAAILAVLVGLAWRLNILFAEAGKARAALAAGLARLEATQATRDKLFSIISHDLRGPMGGMRNFLEGLVEDRETLSRAELAEGIEVLATTAAGTTELLEELLEWARSQQGEIRFEPLRLPLAPLAAEVASILDSAASAKELRISLEIEEGLEVFADADMLRTLLRNILGNAVKYSMRGGTVRLAATRAEAEVKGGVRIGVSDEGIGMDEELAAKVFDAVSLRSRPGTAGERGSGLGLAICKNFAERHGGSLTARSEPGKGSTFELFLPGPREAPAS